MSKNPKLRKNGGKGTFFGNLLRGITRVGGDVAKPILDVVSGGKVSDIVKAISGSKELTEQEKEMLLAELEQDVIEMQEVTKRWQSDMTSDSWLSKNIRPLSLAFLTLSLFVYIILDSSTNSFKVGKEWVDLLSSLLLLVYGGYFGTRAVEKITKIRSQSK
jgi:hypothetical protein